MPRVPIALAQKSSRSRFGVEGNGRAINCYAEPLGSEGKAGFALYPVDGMTVFAEIPNTEMVRALLPLPQDNRLYGVAGRQIFSVDSSGAASVIGGILTDGFTTMAANRRANDPQIGVTADGSSYIIQSGAVLPVTDPDLKPANSVCELDNYLVWTYPAGGFSVSDLGNAAAIDGLATAEEETKSDGLVRGFSFNRQLLLFGTASTGFWVNTGGDPLPFTREFSNEVGCLAGGSVAVVDQAVMFVAHDGTVRRLDGYQAQRVSDHWVERAIADDTDKPNLSAISWSDRGHFFYALSGVGFTAIYDAATQLWAERKTYGFNRWNVSAYATYNGRHVFGSSTSGVLLNSSLDTTTENGLPIICEAWCPLTHASPDRLRWDALYADVIPSTIEDGTPGASPVLMVDYSDDGGRVWSAQRIVAASTPGTRMGRVQPLRRLGVAPAAGRTIRLSWDAAKVRGITGAMADVEKLRA